MDSSSNNKRYEDSFRFEYNPGIIRYGRGCVDQLRNELERQDIESVLVVTGSNVGENPDVMEPVKKGLGECLAGVFAETTPEKRLETAYRGLEKMDELGADGIIGLGGGSSLDTAKVIGTLASLDRTTNDITKEFEDTGSIRVGYSPPLIFSVPTTLAGADLSMVAGVTASPSSGLVDKPVSGGVSDPGLMPSAIFYDPEIFATTPRNVLSGSAMNGFNKGIETIYARNSNPVTDSTAVMGLKKFKEGLIEFGEEPSEDWAFDKMVKGILLVQYGISRPGETTLSIIHSFGHGLTKTYEVQQGDAHAVVTPHVLEYVFENVDGRRELLSEALGVDNDAEEIVGTVSEVRDVLDLPSRLRDIEGPELGDFERVAENILKDSFMKNSPPGLDPTQEEIVDILEKTW